MFKICNKCKVTKNLSFFYADKSKKLNVDSRCKECAKSARKEHYRQNKQESDTVSKKYYNKNREEILKYKIEYNKKNKQRLNEARKLLFEKRPERRIASNLRSRLSIALKNNQKTGSAVQDLGCSFEELKQHLESKFQPGMTWENYGRN